MEPRPIPAPGETEDWKPGDLAECIFRGPWFDGAGTGEPGAGPSLGEIRAVNEVQIRYCPFSGERLWLAFATFGHRRYAARLFRKITPRADAAERGDAAWLDKFLSTPLTEVATCDS